MRRAGALAAGLLAASAACAQDGYPNKVVRIVTSAAGGGSDVVSRLLAPGLTAALGQQVIVDNRGSIAPEIAAKTPADGYTLLVSGSPLWLLPLLRPHTPWDAVRDFTPVALAVTSPSLLVVHPSLPVKSVRELIALAKAKPGELNWAAGTIGATPHLAGELFKSMARVNMVRVPYKGSGPAVVALMAGEVHLMFPGAPSAMPYVKQGRLKALAVCSLELSPLAPGLPTVAATGLPGYESVSPQGVFAPARTPPAIVGRLNQEVARVLHGADIKEKLLAGGMQVVAGSPEDFAAAIKADIARITRLVRETGIKEE